MAPEFNISFPLYIVKATAMHQTAVVYISYGKFRGLLKEYDKNVFTAYRKE
jgi:UDP:flavonoid glycosyltransferase YjiC (YdhE family)